MLLLGIHPYLLSRPTIQSCFQCKKPFRATRINPTKEAHWHCESCKKDFFDAWLMQQNELKLLRHFDSNIETITYDKVAILNGPLRCNHVDCRDPLRISLNQDSWTQNAICSGCGQHYCVTNLRDSDSPIRQMVIDFIQEHSQELIDRASLFYSELSRAA